MYEPVTSVLGVPWADYEIDEDLACCCEGNCAAECQCGVRSGGFGYDEHGALDVRRTQERTDAVYECWERCTCAQDCRNRGSQRAEVDSLRVVPCGEKGLGVTTTAPIAAGTYITEYYGQYSPDPCDGAYVFELTERFGDSEYVWRVDAGRCGGVSRFFNHSCEANMTVVPVRVGHTVPRLAFFALRPISAGEELTFRYRPTASIGRTCLCHSLSCCGFY